MNLGEGLEIMVCGEAVKSLDSKTLHEVHLTTINIADSDKAVRGSSAYSFITMLIIDEEDSFITMLIMDEEDAELSMTQKFGSLPCMKCYCK